MLTRILLTGSLLFASASSFAALGLPDIEAQMDNESWYAGLQLSAVFPNSVGPVPASGFSTLTYDSSGIGGALSLGYRSGPFRYEIQYQYTQNNHSKLGAVKNGGSTRTHSGLANIFYDFDISDTFVPYVGGGVGYTYVEATKLPSLKKGSQAVVGYQGTIGLNVNIDEAMTVDVNYRYFGTGKAKTVLGDRIEYHLVSLGIRYFFSI